MGIESQPNDEIVPGRGITPEQRKVIDIAELAIEQAGIETLAREQKIDKLLDLSLSYTERGLGLPENDPRNKLFQNVAIYISTVAGDIEQEIKDEQEAAERAKQPEENGDYDYLDEDRERREDFRRTDID